MNKALTLKAFLAVLLFLPNIQNNLFAHNCSPTEELIFSYSCATVVVAENEVINTNEALNEPFFYIPFATHFYTKLNNVSKYLVADLGRTIKAETSFNPYTDIDDTNATTFKLQETLIVTAYKKHIL